MPRRVIIIALAIAAANRGVDMYVNLVQMMVLAFALTTDVREIRTAVLDEDAIPVSRRVVKAFEGGGYFKVVTDLPAQRDIAAWMETGHLPQPGTVVFG